MGFNHMKSQAFKDITKDLDYIEHVRVGLDLGKSKKETYAHSVRRLDTKETRSLNRELGIHKINK